MTNYTSLTLDCTDLVSQAATFATAKEISSNSLQWLDWFMIPGLEEEAKESIPSFGTIFDELNLTPVRIMTYLSCTTGEWLDPLVPKRDHFIIPLDNKAAKIKFYSPNAGAEKHSTVRYYLSDCTLEEELASLSGPIMVKREVPYIVEPSDPEDGPLLLYVFFAEQISGLLED